MIPAGVLGAAYCDVSRMKELPSTSPNTGLLRLPWMTDRSLSTGAERQVRARHDGGQTWPANNRVMSRLAVAVFHRHCPASE